MHQPYKLSCCPVTFVSCYHLTHTQGGTIGATLGKPAFISSVALLITLLSLLHLWWNLMIWTNIHFLCLVVSRLQCMTGCKSCGLDCSVHSAQAEVSLDWIGRDGVLLPLLVNERSVQRWNVMSTQTFHIAHVVQCACNTHIDFSHLISRFVPLICETYQKGGFNHHWLVIWTGEQGLAWVKQKSQSDHGVELRTSRNYGQKSRLKNKELQMFTNHSQQRDAFSFSLLHLMLYAWEYS